MICVPIKKKDINELIRDFKEAQEKADLCEIWFEELSPDSAEQNIEKIFKEKKKPILYKAGSDQEKILSILKHGVDYIDLDFSSKPALIKKIKKDFPKTRIIISFHDFETTPKTADLCSIASKMKKKGADIIKIATMAKSASDSYRMLGFINKMREEKNDVIALCMGEEGRLTRAAGHLMGNYLMYAPLRKSDQTAPGQILLDELIEIQAITK